MGRTVHAVYIRRHKLNADSLRRPWTEAEDRLLMRLPEEVAAKYLRRTHTAILSRRSQLGLLKDVRPFGS